MALADLFTPRVPEARNLCECARRQYGIFSDYVFLATGGATFLQSTLDGDRTLLGGRDVYLFPRI